MTSDEQTFSEYRKLLFAIAYRLLGSAADAEDVVQDAWFKWSGADRSLVSDPKAYLARIVSNLAVERLRSTRRQRETYVGPWLPEPILTQADAAEDVATAESVSLAMGLYFAFLGLTQFVQIPHQAAGYGFGATVLEASVVYLLPGAVTGFLVALASGRFIDRFGARPVLVVAAMAGIAGFLFIALVHSAPWQIIVASILANAYISLGYGALPALVVSEVSAGETGVATGMNAIARTIGSAIAAAVVAVLLGRSATGTSVPMESSFIAIFLGGAITAALAMVLIALSKVQARGIDTVEARYESRAMPGSVLPAQVHQRDRSALAEKVAPPVLRAGTGHSDDEIATGAPVADRDLERLA